MVSFFGRLTFDDVRALLADVLARLSKAVEAVDATRLPTLTPYAKRPD